MNSTITDKEILCILNSTPEYKEIRSIFKKGDKNHKLVPAELKTQEICNIAIKSLGWSLKYVPEQFRTQELIKLSQK